MALEHPRRNKQHLGFQGTFLCVWSLFGLDLSLRHDGGGAARFTLFVDPAFHDLHALEILLNDFFPGEFDVLFRLAASPFAHSVDHMFLHQDADLLGQIGAGREL